MHNVPHKFASDIKQKCQCVTENIKHSIKSIKKNSGGLNTRNSKFTLFHAHGPFPSYSKKYVIECNSNLDVYD